MVLDNNFRENAKITKICKNKMGINQNGRISHRNISKIGALMYYGHYCKLLLNFFVCTKISSCVHKVSSKRKLFYNDNSHYT